MGCVVCRGVGWVLEYAGGGNVDPAGLELLPCLAPDCPVSGRPIATLGVHGAGFTEAPPHPTTGVVMGLSVG